MNKVVSFSVTVMVFGAIFPTAANAQRRPDVRNMTCDQAKTLVEQEGGIVLTTGQYTYDRYVSDQMYCPLGLDTKDAWVDTGDGQSCHIGYTCVAQERYDPLDSIRIPGD